MLATNFQADRPHEKCKRYGRRPYRLKATQCTYTQVMLNKRRCIGQIRKELKRKSLHFHGFPADCTKCPQLQSWSWLMKNTGIFKATMSGDLNDRNNNTSLPMASHFIDIRHITHIRARFRQTVCVSCPPLDPKITTNTFNHMLLYVCRMCILICQYVSIARERLAMTRNTSLPS